MIQSKNNKERSGKTMLTCLDITDFLYKPKKTTALCVSEGENTPGPEDSFKDFALLSLDGFPVVI